MQKNLDATLFTTMFISCITATVSTANLYVLNIEIECNNSCELGQTSIVWV